MIGHQTQKNCDLPPLRGSAAKKKPPFFNAHAPMTREIMCSRDVQIMPYWGMILMKCGTSEFVESRGPG